MTRFATAGNETEAAKPKLQLTVFAALDFPTGMVRAHSGIGTVTWGGNDWLGVGQFGGIDAVTEDFSGIARPVRLSLSGVDTSLLDEVVDQTYQSRTVTIYVGFFSTETGALAGDPEVVWEGLMDTATITVDGSQGTISLNCEPRLRREPRIARYTNEDQQLLHSGDRFFDLVYAIKGFVSKWGQKNVYGGLRSSQTAIGGGRRSSRNSMLD